MVRIKEDGININASHWMSGDERKKGTNFKLNKIDAITQEPVANAIFTLEKEIAPGSQTFTFCAKKTTNILGIVEFNDLVNGRYRLKEEQDTGVEYRQRLIIEPSDGINDEIYYYFSIKVKKGRRCKDVTVTAYDDASAMIEAKMLDQTRKNVRFIISIDPQGAYVFAPQELVLSDGKAYTGNYYAEQEGDGIWKLIENSIGFVPNGQISIQALPVGRYFIRPVNSMVTQEALSFHVTPRTRAVFVDYSNQKTYELLKTNEGGLSLASFSNKYKRKRRQKRRKKIVVFGTLVFGLSVLGMQLKKTLDN